MLQVQTPLLQTPFKLHELGHERIVAANYFSNMYGRRGEGEERGEREREVEKEEKWLTITVCSGVGQEAELGRKNGCLLCILDVFVCSNIKQAVLIIN